MGLVANVVKQLGKFSLQANIGIESELVVLFGPSGAGKSLFLRLIAGLIPPDSGTVSIGDKILFDPQKGINLPPQRRHMGYVFQSHSLFPHLTVLQNIQYGAKDFGRKERHQMAMDLIQTFKIEDQKDKLPHQISGGQQQRAALARAIIRKPDALLLDEPFSALDTPTRIEVGEYVRNVSISLKIPVLLVTHDVLEASCLADRMVVMMDGRVLQQGVPAQIIKYPSSDRIEMLVRLRSGVKIEFTPLPLL